MMNLFDEILTKPIFNLLAVVYSAVGDFGISIIIVTVIIRLLMWPLVKCQLHQAKLMRDIKPELDKIKRSNKDKMVQATMMMALYKERGIKQSYSIAVNLIQLPILLAIFNVTRTIVHFHTNAVASNYLYGWLNGLPRVNDLIGSNPQFNLFGVIDLGKSAATYAPALVIVLICAILQYIQAKQLLPKSDDVRGIRKILHDASNGERIDQSEINQAATRRMSLLMPVVTFFISIPFPSAVILFYATSSLVAVIQQQCIFNQDQDELKNISNERAKHAKSVVVRRKQLASDDPVVDNISTKTTIRRKAK